LWWVLSARGKWVNPYIFFLSYLKVCFCTHIYAGYCFGGRESVAEFSSGFRVLVPLGDPLLTGLSASALLRGKRNLSAKKVV
jgi:hypothetical protein